MFGLFNRKRKEVAHSSTGDKVAGKIVRAIIRVQHQWAGYMHRKTTRYSASAKKYTLIVFCLLAGGYSLYVAIESLTRKQSSAMTVTPIKRPRYITQAGDEKLQPVVIISEKEYAKIVRFRQYMDSISRTVGGKKKADSILLARPGLMDSILHLEQLYRLQQSKK